MAFKLLEQDPIPEWPSWSENDSAGERTPGAVLVAIVSPVTFDVVIIGNGILANALAFELTESDAAIRVAIVGPSNQTGSASRASGAMLNCFGEITKYTLASDAGRRKFTLLQSAALAWPRWLERLNGALPSLPPLRAGAGTTVIQNARGGNLDSDNFHAFIDALSEFGEPNEEIDPRSVRGLDPVPDSRPLRAIYLPREGWVDSGAVLDRLVAVTLARGVQRIDSDAIELVAAEGRVVGCITVAGDSVRGGTTVVAAGASSSALLDTVCAPGAIQPVFSGCGVAMVSKRVMGTGFDHVVRSVNRAGSCGLHLVPGADALEYIGATNVIFREPEHLTWPGICHFLAQCAMEQIDQAITYSRITEWRIGNRPISLDTFPLVGRAPVDGLYVMTGTFRDGFHSSPVLAGEVARDIISGDPALEGAFAPDRRPISTMTAEESVDEFTMQSVSSAFESNTQIPRFWHPDDLARSFRPLAEQVYTELGIDWGLSPDLVGFLAVSRKHATDTAAVTRYLRAVDASGQRA